MKRLVMMAVAVGATIAATAMPTRKDLAKAQEMVSDVTAADVAALKAGTKKPAEVAAKHMELAGQAGSEAEKYLLLQGAFRLFVKGEDYENAAKAIETMQAEIKDFNPEVIVELCGKALVRKMQENAPRLYALKENARRIVFYRRQLPIREAAARKKPRDPYAQRKLAECHAELGDWPKALEVFVKAGGEFKKISEGETSGKIPAQELGDFWWDYETKSDTQVYKLHAAELYRKALADDSFKGLARTRAEQRAKECEALTSFAAANRCSEGTGAQSIDLSKPLVLDLGHGQKFSFLPCLAGSFEMGGTMSGYPGSDGKHKVIITRSFYYLPSFVQSNQWAAVMSKKIEKTDALFVGTRQEHEEYLSKLTARFAGKIPKGYVFRFLTEAEYLYAVNKGKMISSEWSGFFLDLFGADQNGKWQRDVHCWKGSHGLEGAGDQHVKHLTYEDVETDPLVYCRDYVYPKTLVFDFQYRQKKSKSLRFPMFARIAIGPDLVAEKKAIQEKTGTWPISTPAENISSVNANGGGAAASVKLAGFANRTFDLGCERKLEMIACPAGEFTMGEKTVKGDCNEVRKHRVKITRPFWLSKVSVTGSQWRKMMYGEVVGKESCQYDFAAVNSHMDRKRHFMEKLNKMFAAELPKGYVFRLPTEAELAYAMTSGGRDKVTELSIGVLGPSEQDKEKVIQKLTATGAKLHRAGKDRATKVGMAKPNTWGFYDVINNGHPEVLDMVAPNSRMRKMKRDDKGNYLNISYEDFETDPLCWDEGEKDVAPLHCDQAKFWVRCTLGGWGWNEVFRVCLGPDLVAEKKSKGK